MDGHFIIASLLLSIIFGFYFSGKLKPAERSSLQSIYFFVFVFVLSLSAQLWIQALGPKYSGLDPVLLICLAVVFFIIVNAAVRRSARSQSVKKESGMLIGIFFWLCS